MSPILHASANSSGPITSAPSLIGLAYGSASATDRAKIVSRLMQPLGLLSLASIARGVFASIRIRISATEADVQATDVESIQARDVVILAKRAQKVKPEVVEGTLQMLTLGLDGAR